MANPVIVYSPEAMRRKQLAYQRSLVAMGERHAAMPVLGFAIASMCLAGVALALALL